MIPLYISPSNSNMSDEFNQTKRNKVKTEDVGEYKGENLGSEDQKKLELICPEMQNEFGQTDDELSHGSKRKERGVADTGSDLGDQMKPKFQQCRTLEAVPEIEEATNGGKEPSETKKDGNPGDYSVSELEEKPEMVCKEDEFEHWLSKPLTEFAGCLEDGLEEGEFQPLETFGEFMDDQEILLSLEDQEGFGQLRMKKTDEEVLQDGGIRLADLEFDLQEEQGPEPDMEKKENQELLDEIFTGFAKELKP